VLQKSAENRRNERELDLSEAYSEKVVENPDKSAKKAMGLKDIRCKGKNTVGLER